jgi:hypothetical protein
MAVTAQGDLSDYTTLVLTSIEEKIAMEMEMSKDNVEVTVAAGSVVLTVVCTFPDEATATAASTALTTAMDSPASASVMLSTSAMAITVEAIVAAPVAAEAGAVVDIGGGGLSTGAIAGIAAGSAVGVIALATMAFMMMKKKSASDVQITKGAA